MPSEQLRDAQTHFVELMAELFQLDEAEALDFGIYRVIRHRNRAVRDFLGEIETHGEHKQLAGGKLQQILEDEFAATDAEAVAQMDARLRELEGELGLTRHMADAAREAELVRLSAVPKLTPTVREYRQVMDQRAAAGHGSDDRLEVLNRLYQFFDRHYQDGDFIVQRRYGRDAQRYIRSTGEDTEFRWATEDMYYIKSGDIFTDWPVKLAHGTRVVFAVDKDSLEATRKELKPTDKAHYELKAVKQDGEAWRVVLDYKKGAAKKSHDEAIVAKVREKTREAEDDINRWLKRYAARNQSDFFIHKRLGEALNEELDIFLKTDVLDAGQLLAGEDRALRHARVARSVQRIGRQIIAFLAALEDFQKQLWEKKKLVLETRYIITLDRIEKLAGREWLEARLAEIIKHQKKEWQELGLGEYKKPKDCERKVEGGLFDEKASKYLPLPVDTGNLDAAFKWELLAAINGLTDSLDGILIHGENWQALNAMQAAFADRIKCIYIDPPYNTDTDGFPYKDSYKDASWMAMITDRLASSQPLLCRTGALFASIDHIERAGLTEALSRTFGKSNRVEEIIWAQNTTKNQSPSYSTNHEYVPVWARDRAAAEADPRMFREPKPGASELLELAESLNPEFPTIAVIEQAIHDLFDKHRAEFREELDEQGIEYDRSLDTWKGLYNYSHAEYRGADGKLIPEDQARRKKARIWVWREGDSSMPAGKQSETTRTDGDANYRFYAPSHPNTGQPCKIPKRGWAWPKSSVDGNGDRQTFDALAADDRIAWGDNETKIPQVKKFLHEMETQVSKSVVIDYTDGEKELTNLCGKTNTFPNPKPTTLINRFVSQTADDGEWVLDYFAGSGTTGQAVLNAYHDDPKRHGRALLVEGGQHFGTVLVPRIKRCIAAWHWKKGKPLALDGWGGLYRVETLEQYDDTLENLAIEPAQGGSGELPLEDAATLLRWRLNAESRHLYCTLENFRSPFGYRLRRAQGAGAAELVEVDLVESLVWLLGLDVASMRREAQGVAITGKNRRGESVLVAFRDCDAKGSGDWVLRMLVQHPAGRVYTNDPADLAFAGAEKLESIEAVFATQFGGAA